MLSLAVLALVASSALAQTVSSTCSAVLMQLNQDPSLSSCTSAMMNVTARYSSANSSNPTAATVTSDLNRFCSSTITYACDKTMIRSSLAKLYAACQSELVGSSNPDVTRTYAELYALVPFAEAICSKDDSGAYCVISATAPSAAALKSEGGYDLQHVLALLSTPSPSKQNAVIPNVTAFSALDIPFLLINPHLNSSVLCTPCTRNVLMAYIDFESDEPYATGLDSSPLLSSQSKLYSAVQSVCPPTFMKGAVQAAGGISSNTLGSSGASALSVPSPFASITVATLALVSVFLI